MTPLMNRRDLLKSSVVMGAASLRWENALGNVQPRLHVPSEESPHACTFMQWPVHRGVHPDGRFLKALQQTIADIANAIVEFEPVVMLAADADYKKARRHLSSDVEHWNIPTEDLWCRDSGPLFAKDDGGNLVISHLQFNGWGNKQVHVHDGQIASRIARHLDIPLISSGLSGEAGGVEHDGEGLLMAHESSWVNENRNPGMSRVELEQQLLQAYGGNRMLWAPGVRGEDITDYHIDSLARFTGPGRVLINLPSEPDSYDVFHRAALETLSVLESSDVELEVISEPDWNRVDSFDFVSSYANYYVCNGGVVAAQFGDAEADELAVAALRRHYPDREVITLNVDALGEVGGGIHCATQQMPVS